MQRGSMRHSAAALVGAGAGRDHLADVLAASPKPLRPSSAKRERGDGEPTATFSDQLGAAQTSLKASLDRAAAELTAAIEGRAAEGSKTPAMLRSGARGTLDWLAGAVAEAVNSLSSEHQELARTQLKAQATMYDVKLSHARTAASVKLANQAVELESSMHRKLEEQLRELSSAEGAVLAAAHEQLEAAKRELAAEHLRAATATETLGRTKQLLEASDAKAEETAAEKLRCEALLNVALSELDVSCSTQRTLEQRVQELVAQSRKQHAELSGAHDELSRVCYARVVALPPPPPPPPPRPCPLPLPSPYARD